MLIRQFIQVGFVTLIFSMSSFVFAKDDSKNLTLFRFKNDQGTVVTAHILPPEAAYRGYQIITYEGDILETIAPAPTEVEKKQILAQQEQEKYDKALLLRYSTLAELMRTQKRKRDESTSKLSVLNSNYSNIKHQIEAEQAKAANYERQGREISDLVITNLEQLYGNLERTEDLIQQRTRELEEEEKQYAEELERYKQLKGLK